MNKKRVVKGILALATVVMVQGTVGPSVSANKLPLEYNSHKKQVKGGTLHVGLASGGGFKGIFAPPLRIDGPTSEVAQFGEYSLFSINDDYTYAKGGLADVTFDQKQKNSHG